MSEWVEGTVQRVVYTAPDSGYAVVRLLQGETEHTVVGYFADTVGELQGNFLALEGTWEQHAVHGSQFRATGTLSAAPRTIEGLKLYLASSGLPGIGPVLASRIVDEFGLQVLRILGESPHRLTEVDGIGRSRAQVIAEKWARDEGERALSILLRGLGVSQRIVTRVRAVYGESAGDVVRNQPYRLCQDVQGVGFRTADQLARAQGVDASSPARASAAVLHVIQTCEQRGHCYVDEAQLRAGCRGLDVPEQHVGVAVCELASAKRVHVAHADGATQIWRMALWVAESRVAQSVVARSRSQRRLAFSDDEIRKAEQAEGISLDTSQRRALRLALESQFAVITGGPGTGKTTILRVYMRLMERGERHVVLASPTGRAARRLAAATDRPASTLHRLLSPVLIWEAFREIKTIRWMQVESSLTRCRWWTFGCSRHV